jgi:hypothetical protein
VVVHFRMASKQQDRRRMKDEVVSLFEGLSRELAGDTEPRRERTLDELSAVYASEPVRASEALQRSNAAHALAKSQIGDDDD